MVISLSIIFFKNKHKHFENKKHSKSFPTKDRSLFSIHKPFSPETSPPTLHRPFSIFCLHTSKPFSPKPFLSSRITSVAPCHCSHWCCSKWLQPFSRHLCPLHRSSPPSTHNDPLHQPPTLILSTTAHRVTNASHCAPCVDTSNHHCVSIALPSLGLEVDKVINVVGDLVFPFPFTKELFNLLHGNPFLPFPLLLCRSEFESI